MTLEELQEELSYCLDRVKRMFKPGVKVTLIVRSEDDPLTVRLES